VVCIRVCIRVPTSAVCRVAMSQWMLWMLWINHGVKRRPCSTQLRHSTAGTGGITSTPVAVCITLVISYDAQRMVCGYITRCMMHGAWRMVACYTGKKVLVQRVGRMLLWAVDTESQLPNPFD
jgi:hypothetical protein